MKFDYASLLAQADVHIKNKELPQAEHLYSTIREVDANNVGALNGLAVVAIYKKNHPQAILLLKEAIAANANVAYLHYNLSICHSAQSNLDQALQCCQKAIDLDAQYNDAQQFLIKLYEKKSAQLADTQHWQDALNALTHILTLAEQFLNAEHYYQLGFYSEKSNQLSLAKYYWQKALLIDSHHSKTQIALDNLYRTAVPNWHLPMMNDAVRNDAFQAAIKNAITNNQTVLDIGTGSGLMAMIAARAGAKKVYACEEVELIADKAAEIIKLNGFTNQQISLLKKRSTQINIPNDIPDKVDLIITETFGTGLIEENCLETIDHAVKNLLKPAGKIIPKGAALFLSLVESKDVYQLRHTQEICGFDLSAFNEFSEAPKGMCSDHLNHYQYKLLSNTQLIETFDFYSHSPLFEEKHLELTINTDGVGHVLCLWFAIYLDDTTTITTDPTADSNLQAKSWGQRMQALSEPLPVRKGEKIKVGVTHANNFVNVKLI